MQIDLKNEIQKYKPIDPSCLPDEPSEKMEDLRNSILLYNKAIERIKTKSEDIAVIELKKAVALNPDFAEAMYLLGLCYIHNKDYAKAEDVLKRVRSMEYNEENVTNYIEMLTGERSRFSGSEPIKKKKKSQKSENTENIQQTIKTEKIALRSKPAGRLSIYQFNKMPSKRRGQTPVLRYFLMSVIAACLIIFGTTVIRSGIIASQKGDGENTRNSKTIHNNTKAENTQVSAKGMNKTAENSEEINRQLEYQKNIDKLTETEKLLGENKYEAAADILVGLKNVGFEAADKQKYDGLSAEVIPKAAWNAYVKGEADFNTTSYRDAISNLKKITSYGYEWEYVPVAMYHLGMSYKELGDRNSALKVFEDIGKRFPDSEYAQYSVYRINEINSGATSQVHGFTGTQTETQQEQAYEQNQVPVQEEQSGEQVRQSEQEVQPVVTADQQTLHEEQKDVQQTQGQDTPTATPGENSTPEAQQEQQSQSENQIQIPSQNQSTVLNQ